VTVIRDFFWSAKTKVTIFQIFVNIFVSPYGLRSYGAKNLRAADTSFNKAVTLRNKRLGEGRENSFAAGGVGLEYQYGIEE
jgi:hypothetical protein